MQPSHDPIQNVDNIFASFENGATLVRFSRLKDTGDVNDFSLSDCVYFLHAWGGAVYDINTKQVAYHGAFRRFVSESLECIPTSTSFCPESKRKQIQLNNSFGFILIYLFSCLWSSWYPC